MKRTLFALTALALAMAGCAGDNDGAESVNDPEVQDPGGGASVSGEVEVIEPDNSTGSTNGTMETTGE